MPVFERTGVGGDLCFRCREQGTDRVYAGGFILHPADFQKILSAAGALGQGQSPPWGAADPFAEGQRLFALRASTGGDFVVLYHSIVGVVVQDLTTICLRQFVGDKQIVIIRNGGFQTEVRTQFGGVEGIVQRIVGREGIRDRKMRQRIG